MDAEGSNDLSQEAAAIMILSLDKLIPAHENRISQRVIDLVCLLPPPGLCNPTCAEVLIGVKPEEDTEHARDRNLGFDSNLERNVGLGRNR